MSLVLDTPRGARSRARRRERRRLAELDRLAAHLTDLERIRRVVGRAAAVVAAGWVQDGWFATLDARGRERVVGGGVRLRADRPVVGACLVGAIVQGGGGPGAAATQPVQRALDLTWHALRGDPARPVRWCPGPRARALHVLELTRWNDDPRRTRAEVTGLLRAADGLAGQEVERTRAERAGLAGDRLPQPA
jgi:hypothetical protein